MNGITAYTDGACEGNPGCIGIGGIAIDDIGNDLLSFTKTAGKGTNNEAEYLAFIEMLTRLINGSFTNQPIVCNLDSKLVVEQVNGNWSCNKDSLLKLRDNATSLMEQFVNLTVQWVPRQKNKRADKLSKQALTGENKSVDRNAVNFSNPETTERVGKGGGIINHKGIGFSVIDSGKLFAVNLNPLNCSCAASSPCKHVVLILKQYQAGK